MSKVICPDQLTFYSVSKAHDFRCQIATIIFQDQFSLKPIRITIESKFFTDVKRFSFLERLPQKLALKIALRFLSDGSLYFDNQQTVEVFDKGFCIENFVDNIKRVSAISIFYCTPFVPILNMSSPNKLNGVKVQ